MGHSYEKSFRIIDVKTEYLPVKHMLKTSKGQTWLFFFTEVSSFFGVIILYMPFLGKGEKLVQVNLFD